MKKRDFLAVAAWGGASFSLPALLTITGAIGKGNRGPIDPALDQMMAKQEISFDKAHAVGNRDTP